MFRIWSEDMESLRNSLERKSQLASHGAVIANHSEIEINLEMKSVGFVAGIAGASEISKDMRKIPNTRPREGLLIIMPILKGKDSARKNGIFRDMAQLLNGIKRNLLNRMRDVRFAVLQLPTFVVISCSLTTGMDAVREVRPVTNVAEGFFAAGVTTLSNASTIFRTGLKRRLPTWRAIGESW